jgi:transposase-like protein
MSDHGEHGEEAPEFKAEIVGLCQQGDRSVGQVARDFDLTETAVREWVKQAERDAGIRSDGGLTSTEQRELAELSALSVKAGQLQSPLDASTIRTRRA